jgi:hypothetical protein
MLFAWFARLEAKATFAADSLTLPTAFPQLSQPQSQAVLSQCRRIWQAILRLARAAR